MKINSQRLEKYAILFFIIVLLISLYLDSQGSNQFVIPIIISLAIFTILSLYKLYRLKQKLKSRSGKYFLYHNLYIFKDIYAFIIFQLILIIYAFKLNSEILKWVVIAFWITILTKALLKHIYGGFYVLISDDEIEINEKKLFYIDLNAITSVKKSVEKYSFYDAYGKRTLIIFKRINASQRAEFKELIDEKIDLHQIKFT
ncbi:hypothetical protein [Chondrinema litorale]|uniref:hypothetical protein n=1 Tax=Chondrinema litorale TaxID=2994555 RepID=UPI002542790D|nr:hypothetical protein [Chondrinema litorale]UZR99542.1 hypothetical protein OQ292_36735 [Chondrinema litorale]